MPKFTLAERQFIKSIVATASLKRLTDNEIIAEIQKHLTDKEPVTRNYLYRVRRSIKKDSFNWYNNLREAKYDYIQEFKELINGIYWLQKQHYEIIQSTNNQSIRQVSLAELHRLNITLSNYLDVMPDILTNATLPATSNKESNEQRQQRQEQIILV